MLTWIFSAFLAICLVIVSLEAQAAEFYLDAYGGVAVTEDSKVEVTLNPTGLFAPKEKASTTADYEPGVSTGLRGGLWWGNVPWLGMAQDFSYFRAEADEVEVDVYSMSTMLMLRVPLARSDDFPSGRIFPFVGAGPSLYYAEAEADLRPAVSDRASGDTWDIGYQALTGLQWRLDRHWSLFGEYRFTYRDVNASSDSNSGCFICFVDESVDTTLKSHHVLLGVSFWF